MAKLLHHPANEMCVTSYPRSLGHIGLTVSDVNRAVDWYRDVLGFTVLAAPHTIEPDDEHVGELLTQVFGDFKRVEIAHLSTASGVSIEFLEFADTGEQADIPYQRAGWSHICVIDPEVEALATRIDNNGGDHYMDVWKVFPEEEYELTYCRDPFGNQIEIYSHSDERIYSNRS